MDNKFFIFRQRRSALLPQRWKALIVRYGGMRLHNAAVPFFLGRSFGDFLVGSLWAIAGPLPGMQTYKVFI